MIELKLNETGVLELNTSKDEEYDWYNLLGCSIDLNWRASSFYGEFGITTYNPKDMEIVATAFRELGINYYMETSETIRPAESMNGEMIESLVANLLGKGLRTLRWNKDFTGTI